MAFSTQVKDFINVILSQANLRLETLTSEHLEKARLLQLERNGQYREAVFPIPPQFFACDPRPLLQTISKFKDTTSRFAFLPNGNNYCFSNDYFTASDAEVGYAIVRTVKPKRLIEIGSGNSTRLFRAAIQDGKLDTEIVSIDPSPRIGVETVANRVVKQRVERLNPSNLVDALQDGDILFIDSSHEIRSGNDVVYLLLNIVPSLKAGVIIHIHDIFLPFDYPADWIIKEKYPWNEQYLVQALLHGSNQFEILWPGHFLQRTLPDFDRYFHAQHRCAATSLWLRKSS